MGIVVLADRQNWSFKSIESRLTHKLPVELEQINFLCLQSSASLRHIGFYCLPRDHHRVEHAVLSSGEGHVFFGVRRVEATLVLSGDVTDVSTLTRLTKVISASP
jgi:hypothetical protein